jgi:hypothetical protein
VLRAATVRGNFKAINKKETPVEFAPFFSVKVGGIMTEGKYSSMMAISSEVKLPVYFGRT